MNREPIQRRLQPGRAADGASRAGSHCAPWDELRIRIHGDASLPALIYLPGMHGDWTLVSSFRAAMAGRVCFVEFTYPRTTTWSLDDYARGIEDLLLANGIDCGWLLGESFGSQPAWQIVKRFLDCSHLQSPDPPFSVEPRRERSGAGVSPASSAPGPRRAIDGRDVGSIASRPVFRPLGLVLAGGFVRHPVIWAVRLAQRLSIMMPRLFVKVFCAGYARYARFRHRRAPETFASIGEFVANRMAAADRDAIVHRYTLIADNDLRPVARATRLPVFYLAGLVDPLVPWCYVRWWLRRNCRSYRGGKTVWRADHNVLGTAPRVSAELISRWMNLGVAAPVEAPAISGSPSSKKRSVLGAHFDSKPE